MSSVQSKNWAVHEKKVSHVVPCFKKGWKRHDKQGKHRQKIKITFTFPLLTFSEQARMYMGIAMTTSNQACTVTAFHRDMGLLRVSSACCSRSSCSSPSDRLGWFWLERLSESGLVRRGRNRRGRGVKFKGFRRVESKTKLLYPFCTWKLVYWRQEKEHPPPYPPVSFEYFCF